MVGVVGEIRAEVIAFCSTCRWINRRGYVTLAYFCSTRFFIALFRLVFYRPGAGTNVLRPYAGIQYQPALRRAIKAKQWLPGANFYHSNGEDLAAWVKSDSPYRIGVTCCYRSKIATISKVSLLLPSVTGGNAFMGKITRSAEHQANMREEA